MDREDGKWFVGFDAPCSKLHVLLFPLASAQVWKGYPMRWFCAIVVLLVGSIALGQDAPQPDQLKKMYDNVLGQLRQAQDRKNELAAENEKLNTKLNDLQKQFDSLKTKNDEANREAAGFAERTFFLRSQYAAWQEFIHHFPKLETRWKLFLVGAPITGGESTALIDADWPLSAMSSADDQSK
jgi:cell division protein FtsB